MKVTYYIIFTLFLTWINILLDILDLPADHHMDETYDHNDHREKEMGGDIEIEDDEVQETTDFNRGLDKMQKEEFEHYFTNDNTGEVIKLVGTNGKYINI